MIEHVTRCIAAWTTSSISRTVALDKMQSLAAAELARRSLSHSEWAAYLTLRVAAGAGGTVSGSLYDLSRRCDVRAVALRNKLHRLADVDLIYLDHMSDLDVSLTIH